MTEEVEVAIVIDEREKGPQRAALEEAFPEAKHATLPVGDYIIGERVCIEFKNYQDLAQDASHELWNKLFAMEPFDARFLVVMGDYDDWRQRDPRLRYNRREYELAKARLDGILMAVHFMPSIKLVMVRDADEFVAFVKGIVKRISREPKEYQRPIEVSKRPSRTLSEEVDDMLTAVAGIGRKASLATLTQYRSIADLCEATEEELTSIKGVGKKGAHLREVLHHEVSIDDEKGVI